MILLAVLFLSLASSLVSGKPRHQQDDEDLTFYWRRSHPAPCKPFTTFYQACNKCVCAADSVPYCTRMDCPKEGPTMKDFKHQKVLGTPKDKAETNLMIKRLLTRGQL
ncbi:uncharacterized protein LOC105384517 [Plutella xylostella]|uniref:uncharacterized protein LOC105384517 n=1 Tax=Plutella xylostella TaxID=51655 RepID=UPI002032DF94|nr:uncharacterized protein LOC105384517 [Plutella xylostella]